MNEIITELNAKDKLVGVMRVGNIDYISLTDIAKAENSNEPSFTIKNWLRKIDTINYIGLWEQLHNENFNWSNSTKLKISMEEIPLQCPHHNGLKGQEQLE